MEGSGFTLSTINEQLIQVNRYDPIRGSSYIPLPKYLKEKKAIINVKNRDNMCFKWAVLSAIYPATNNSNRLSCYTMHTNKLKFEGIEFPLKVNHIGKFEKLNPEISINVYMFDAKEKKVNTIRVTKEVKRYHIHLLLLSTQNHHKSEPVYHYCWIKNLSRLITTQISKNKGRMFFCDRCLNHFTRLEKLEEHRLNCMQQNECTIEMSTDADDRIKFKNIKNQMISPFIIYADVEALLKKQDEKLSDNVIAYQQHVVYSVGYYLKCSFDEAKSFYTSRRGTDCIDWFVKELHHNF